VPTATRTVRVLLADDVPDLRMLLRVNLQREGRFTIIAEAEDGLQAVEYARVHQPDLVILDLSMPNLDGLEALPLIHEAAPTTRVVVLSGFDSNRMAEAALTAGAIAYLEKGDILAVIAEIERLAG
jgi:DNA-binding NarL/FixJ family response regulator